jgi:release factor glutamine methyltransferase
VADSKKNLFMTSIDFCAKNFGQARLLAKQLSLPINRTLGQKIKLTSEQNTHILAQITKYEAGYPLDYLLGVVTFCDRDFVVNDNVLIPRPATEYWVNQFIELLSETDHESQSHTYNPKTTLVEVGTGSGVIGLSLSPFFDHSILTDISSEALKLASINQKNLFGGVETIDLIKTNLIQDIELPTKNISWTLVANLPYVPTSDLLLRQKNGVSYEPALALYSGQDGLDLTRELISQLIANYSANMPTQIWLELDPRNISQAKSYIQDQFQNTILKKDTKWIYNILTDEDDFARVLVIKQVSN